jgi:hypothetical protein
MYDLSDFLHAAGRVSSAGSAIARSPGCCRRAGWPASGITAAPTTSSLGAGTRRTLACVCRTSWSSSSSRLDHSVAARGVGCGARTTCTPARSRRAPGPAPGGGTGGSRLREAPGQQDSSRASEVGTSGPVATSRSESHATLAMPRADVFLTPTDSGSPRPLLRRGHQARRPIPSGPVTGRVPSVSSS